MSPPRMWQSDEDPKVASIRRCIDQIDDAFLDRYGAHAVGIGRRRKGKNGTRLEPCLILYVEKGRKGHHAANGVKALPNPYLFDDPVTGKQVKIPTDVVEATLARMTGGSPSPAVPKHPVPGGVSFTVEGSSDRPANSATLGGWAWDMEDQSLVLLSNMHVLGSERGPVIFHPSVLQDPQRIPFGRVKRGTMELNGKQEVDCAIGDVDEPERAEFNVVKIGPAIMTIGLPRREAEVEKTGMATGHTRGTIDNIDWRGRVEDLAHNIRTFSNCTLIEPIGDKKWADTGDSGSLVFERHAGKIKTVVGLHFGSTEIGDTMLGVACRIDKVFDALNLETLPRGLLANLAASLDTGAGGAGTAFDVVLAFEDSCRQSKSGRRLITILDRHRAEIVTLLARSATLRTAGADVLRPLFQGAQGLGQALTRTVDAATVTALSRFVDTLEQLAGEKLRADIPKLRALVEKARGKSLREFLGPAQT